jgi:N-acetylneuraminic acid mutarotase
MGAKRNAFGACVLAGEIYVTGGRGYGNIKLLSVEKYSPSSETWSALYLMPAARSHHSAVAVGSSIYVLGGHVLGDSNEVDEKDDDDDEIITASVLKFDTTQGT